MIMRRRNPLGYRLDEGKIDFERLDELGLINVPLVKIKPHDRRQLRALVDVFYQGLGDDYIAVTIPRAIRDAEEVLNGSIYAVSASKALEELVEYFELEAYRTGGIYFGIEEGSYGFWEDGYMSVDAKSNPRRVRRNPKGSKPWFGKVPASNEWFGGKTWAVGLSGLPSGNDLTKIPRNQGLDYAKIFDAFRKSGDTRILYISLSGKDLAGRIKSEVKYNWGGEFLGSWTTPSEWYRDDTITIYYRRDDAPSFF